MSTYKLWNDPITGVEIGVVRLNDQAWIPADPANCDYQEYLAWVAEGNEAEPWA